MHGESGPRLKLVALAIGLFLILILWALPAGLDREAAALLLVALAGSFLGFGLSDRRPGAIAGEGTIALLCSLAALASLNGTGPALSAGFLLAGLWALGHHRIRLQNFASLTGPVWYASFAGIIALTLAAGTALLWRFS